MRTDGMNEEELRFIIDKLFERDPSLATQVVELRNSLPPTKATTQVINLIHTFFCTSKTCVYNLEETLENPWDIGTEHFLWLQKAKEITYELGYFTPGELLPLFNEAQPMIREMSQLELTSPNAYKLALKIKGLERLVQKLN